MSGPGRSRPQGPENAIRDPPIRARIGDVWFDAWFGDAIPHADEDGVYILAVRSAFMADHINNQFSRILAGLLGRREVRAEFHAFAKVAAHKRKQAEGAP